MKCTINKNDIIDMLANVQGITGKKTTLAITENLLIKAAEQESLSVCATDIETGFEGHYPAKVDEAGQIAVNARYLYDILKKSKRADILIKEEKKQWIEITDAQPETSFKFNIVGSNVDDFPQLPPIHDFNYLSVPSASLKRMILWAILIITNDRKEKRSHILGANLTFSAAEDEKQKMQLFSTDGKRLTKTEEKCESIPAELAGKSLLIPKKGLSEVVKFLKEDGQIQIGEKNNYFILKKENEILYINLLNGEFPDLSTLFQADPDQIQLKLNRQELRDMMERMSILSTEDYKGVIFQLKEGYLYINAANPERGESYEYMEVAYEGQPLETMFNPHYFIDALNLIEEKQVLLKIKSEESPCIVCGEDSPSDINIVMPMRV